MFQKYLYDNKVLLAIAPIVGYCLTMLYQMGYASHFSIPFELIGMNITTIILNLGFVGIVIALFLFLFDIVFSPLLPKKDSPFFYITHAAAILISLAALEIFLAGWHHFSSVFIYIINTIVITPLITPIFRKKGKTYKEEFIAEETKRSEEAKKTNHIILDNIFSRFTRVEIFSLLIIIALGLVTFNAGRFTARTKVKYFETNSNQVILAIYNNDAVIADYNPQTKVVLSSFRIVSIKSIGQSIKLQKIGPLKSVREANIDIGVKPSKLD